MHNYNAQTATGSAERSRWCSGSFMLLVLLKLLLLHDDEYVRGERCKIPETRDEKINYLENVNKWEM